VPDLVKMLKDEDESVRQIAAESLGRMKSEKAVDRLINSLKDDHSGVAYQAAAALGKIASEKALLALAQVWKENTIPDFYLISIIEEIERQDTIACILPKFSEMLSGSDDTYVLQAIASIQNRCKFYNYEIWQAHLAAQQGDNSASQSGSSPSTINQFPNAIEVKIFENVQNYHESPPKDPPP
ncbi:MAG TPA: HEAT repeat domain-containing protein, partial [Candidatus Obscuribacterales bacterium]